MCKQSLLLSDLEKALEQLSKALASSPSSDLEKAGCIQYFEFSFELAWKCIKETSQEQGLPECLSPKSCLRLAFSQEWIDDEETWLNMLQARNLMTHTYDARDALKIYTSLSKFLDELIKLHKKLSLVSA
jgi:nucleotidyltransferase substrate binding protein (TIGR01987 family)